MLWSDLCQSRVLSQSVSMRLPTRLTLSDTKKLSTRKRPCATIHQRPTTHRCPTIHRYPMIPPMSNAVPIVPPISEATPTLNELSVEQPSFKETPKPVARATAPEETPKPVDLSRALKIQFSLPHMLNYWDYRLGHGFRHETRYITTYMYFD
jgi:hypothetical protein